MATARACLKGTLVKLRDAISDVILIDEDVAGLLAGVDDLPLSEAAARVSRGAGPATTVASLASLVMEAAEAAIAAAREAEAAVTAAHEAKAEAEKLAAAMAETAVAATAAAEKAAGAVAALERRIEPPMLADQTWGWTGGSDTPFEAPASTTTVFGNSWCLAEGATFCPVAQRLLAPSDVSWRAHPLVFVVCCMDQNRRRSTVKGDDNDGQGRVTDCREAGARGGGGQRGTYLCCRRADEVVSRSLVERTRYLL